MTDRLTKVGAGQRRDPIENSAAKSLVPPVVPGSSHV
ncbi:Uncharacterised protein [Mycobacteroides abscessus subsp. abscessus]|nr:Uncharacterised protein [Mycobacteroides abscessus subsp. abscessus]